MATRLSGSATFVEYDKNARDGDKESTCRMSSFVAGLLRHWFLLLTLALAVPFALYTAKERPLWWDEILGFHNATAESLSELWHLLATGQDSNPPLFYVLARMSMAVFGQNAFALRFPSVLGVTIMCTAVYAFVAKRLPILYANLALLYALLPPAIYYACEGRPYGVWLGFSGLALVAWQSATDPETTKRWLALFALALCAAAGVATHYFAVLFVTALGIAELWRTWSRRRIDAAMWLTLAAAGLPLLAMGPLIEQAKSFRENLWAAPNWGSLTEVYSELFRFHGMSGPFLGSLFVFVAITVVLALKKPSSIPQAVAGAEQPPAHEIVMAVALAGIPLYSFVLAMTYTNSYVVRYCLPAICGFAILVATAAFRIAPLAKWPIAVLTLLTGILLVANCGFGWRSGQFSNNLSNHKLAYLEEASDRAQSLDAVVVTSDCGFYTEMSFYHPELPLVCVLVKSGPMNGLPPAYKSIGAEKLPTLGRFIVLDALGGAPAKKWALEHQETGLRCLSQPPLRGGQALDLIVVNASR
jgi:uncharacterized membrane protein